VRLYRGKVGKQVRMLSREDLRNIKHLKELSKEQGKAEGCGGGRQPTAGLPSVH
jgi:hypothetical protein